MEYAKMVSVATGSRLRCDDGFTCMNEGDQKLVKSDENGHLFVDCRKGRHYLDGQAEEGRYIGLEIVR